MHAGQNFQLVQTVSHNFYLQVLNPFAKVLKSLSVTIVWTIKKEENKIGPNNNSSSSIELNTFTILLTLGNRSVCNLGNTLQYQA